MSINDPLKALLQPGRIQSALFPPNSRYYGIETATLTDKDGKPVIYLKRRFIPSQESFVQVQEHIVAEGERSDHLAARYLGDPEMVWQLSDANGVMRPEELTDTPGQPLRITLPEGIPGGSNA